MKQRITPGGTIEAATPKEIQDLIQQGNPVEPGDRGRSSGFSGLFNVVAGDFGRGDPVLLTSPPVRRLRVTRNPRGGDAIVIPSTISATNQICGPSEGRLGLQIVNYGANNLFVYLAGYQDLLAAGDSFSGFATLWLKSGGGSWDGSFEDCLWGGSVTVRADAATTTISLAEI